jgi:hypothetical protein
MYNHSAGCATGDNSLGAALKGVEQVAEVDADDYFFFLLSDAMLGRYDVTPRQMGDALQSHAKVNAYAIFIAEPGAATWLCKEMPMGKGFSCLAVDKLPALLQQLFAHAARL